MLACIVLPLTFMQAQQVVINTATSTEELIEDVLFQGCIQVSNVTSPSNGNLNGISSYGMFQQGASNFPFNNGLVLTTGNVTDAGNTFNTMALNEGETDWGGDSDLETILGVSNTLNATSIEFDIIAATDIISFNYILASEEYLNDYPCNYSDSFAFLIKPADNSAPYTNITLVPGTNTPVSTQNIRPEIVGFCGALNEEYFEGFNVGDTNYNGRTKVLTAQTQIQPNTSYHIKLVIADQFDENFDSAVFIEGNTFSSAINLGGTLNTCEDHIVLNSGINNSEATFIWDFNGVPLAENSASITASESGTYHVIATMPYADNQCIIEDTVVVNLNGIEDATPVTNFENCATDNNSQTALFDLSQKNEELAAAVSFTNSLVKYYTTQENAETNNEAITAPFQNSVNPQTIFARIENTDADCVAYTTFDLIVNHPPVLVQPDTLRVCGADDIEIAEFNLSIAGFQAIADNTGIDLSYYISEDDAVNQNNALPVLFTNTSNFQTIYIRAANTATGCYSTIPVVLEVAYGPEILAASAKIDACQPLSGGYTTFDLTSVINELINNPSSYDISFYITEEDAINDVNSIANPENFTNTQIDTQTVYAKITNPVTGCFTLAPIHIYTTMLLSEINSDNYEICDDGDNDGSEAFDLNSVANYIANGLEEVTVTFYATESDRDNQINALDNNVSFVNTSNPQLLYFYIANDECGVAEDILLEVDPNFNVPTITTQSYCDTDADGFTNIELNTFTDLIVNGNNYGVTYYLTENDAMNHTNSVTQFVNTSNPQMVWAAVSNSGATCSAVINFEIQVQAAPNTNSISDIHICDDDNDGLSTIDLTQIIPQLLDDTTDITVEFYISIDNAKNSSNIIDTPENFTTGTQTIYVKSINNTTGCYNIRTLTIYVAFFEDLSEERSTFMLCENDGDQTEGFFFDNYDDTILGGEAGLMVNYFNTEADAINNANPITKNAPFFNTSNPQTLYIRRQSEFDVTCFTVDPITIKVSSYPVFNSPEDIFLCDDISNNGKEFFDLSAAILQMGIDTNNLTVSFYKTRNNANNGINPLPLQYQNIVNPQTIWAKVETAQGCYEAVPFKLNVVHVGLINEPSPISYCDTDSNGYEIIDLTSDDVDVLMIRQNEIALSYFENENDAINLTNVIANPTNYQVNVTTNEPKVIYIVATNTVSDCSLYVPLEISVYPLPQFKEDSTFEVCQDSLTSLWLPSLQDVIINADANLQLSYYPTEADATNDTNALPETIAIPNASINFYAKAINMVSGCSSVKNITINLNQNPPVFNLQDIRTCSNNEYYTFNLVTAINNLLNTPSYNNLAASLYLSEEEAAQNINRLENAENYEAYDQERFYVKVYNTITGCYSISSFKVIFDAVPVIPIEDTYVICPGYPLLVNADTGSPTDTYTWSSNETSPEIEITQPGVYSVTVTSENGCSETKYFGVNASEPAVITDIKTTSFSEDNSIEVTVTGNGQYVYSVDGGSLQPSNVFNNLPIGYHTVEVVDLNGCSSAIATDIAILGFPKYFTPNGDGVNDTWNIFGFETLQHTNISIFDRYGKLIKVINPGDIGWDGTYNGVELPSNDYWFEAKVNDVEEPFTFKAHFTLKR